MDAELRHLERRYDATGDPSILEQIAGILRRSNELLHTFNRSRYERGLLPVSTSNLPDVRTWAGYLDHHVSSSGKLIIFLRSNLADIDPSLGRYAMLCDEHGYLYQTNDRWEWNTGTEADNPEDWCHQCQAEQDIGLYYINIDDRVQNISSGMFGTVTWAGPVDFVSVKWDNGYEQSVVPVNILKKV